MSKIGDLKANENNKVNLVKLLELFCNGDTKYVEMLLRIYKTSGDSPSIKVNAINKRTGIDIDKLKGLTDNEIEIMYHFIDNNMLMANIKEFQKFINYNEKKLIDDNDLQSYKSFNEVKSSVKRADEKIALRELEKQIKKIHEDDEWLILIPLTYESSVKYGYNTKWCTASESTSEQYKSYTRDGLLIYIIQKGKNKTAVYKKRSNNEISFWNQTDTRIDSIQTNFPSNIMEIIKTALNTNHDTRYNPKTGITDQSDFVQPSGLTGLTMSMIEDLLKPISSDLSKKSIFHDLNEYKSYLDKNDEYYKDHNKPSESIYSTSGYGGTIGDNGTSGGSRGIHNLSAMEAQVKAFEQLMDLNSPSYINKVKNLMKKVK